MSQSKLEHYRDLYSQAKHLAEAANKGELDDFNKKLTERANLPESLFPKGILAEALTRIAEFLKEMVEFEERKEEIENGHNE